MPQPVSATNNILDTVSIIVEWENVLLAGSARAESMLMELIKQCNQIEEIIEIIISTNQPCPEIQVRPHDLSDRIDWKVELFNNLHYYQLKNYGARRSIGSKIVFVDSDVIPSDNWLTELLSTFSVGGSKVCCGTAFIDPIDFYNKTFALFWFFPIKSRKSHIIKSDHFFANNIAFDRNTFLSNPYPHDSESSRGACLNLAETLNRKGIAIWQNPKAQVAHPPPQGFINFCLRALAQGRDKQIRTLGINSSAIGSVFRLCRNIIASAIKIMTRFHYVDLKLYQLPASICLASCYFLLYFVGELGSQIRLKYIIDIEI